MKGTRSPYEGDFFPLIVLSCGKWALAERRKPDVSERGKPDVDKDGLRRARGRGRAGRLDACYGTAVGGGPGGGRRTADGARHHAQGGGDQHRLRRGLRAARLAPRVGGGGGAAGGAEAAAFRRALRWDSGPSRPRRRGGSQPARPWPSLVCDSPAGRGGADPR